MKPPRDSEHRALPNGLAGFAEVDRVEADVSEGGRGKIKQRLQLALRVLHVCMCFLFID